MTFVEGYTGPGENAWGGGATVVYDKNTDGFADLITFNINDEPYDASRVYLDEDGDGVFETSWLSRPSISLTHRVTTPVSIEAFPLDPDAPPSLMTMRRFPEIR